MMSKALLMRYRKSKLSNPLNVLSWKSSKKPTALSGGGINK